MGFREMSHTADLALRVWAGDLPGLFAEAARGMNSLAGASISSGPRLIREVDLKGIDNEDLLVSFLTELIYAQENENFGFDTFDLKTPHGRLIGTMEGAPLQALAKPIKAVTYHNLAIKRTGRGYDVELVFDV